MTLYRDILSQALKSSWRHKYLWFFGLFAALMGSAGEYELLFRGIRGESMPLLPGFEHLSETGLLSWQIFGNVGRLAGSDPLNLVKVLGVLFFVMIISVFILWVCVTSQGALVYSASRIRTNKIHNFKESLDVGTKKFWPVLGLNFLVKLIIYGLFFLLTLPVIMTYQVKDLALTSSIYIIAFVIFISLSIVLSFIAKYAIAFVVIKGVGLLTAVRQGWRLFINNWLVSLEMAFILFFINFLIGAALVLAFLIISIPFIFMAFVFAKFSLLFNFWAVILIALMAYLIILVLLSAFMSAFQINSWTSLFIELYNRGGVSKLIRLFGKE